VGLSFNLGGEGGGKEETGETRASGAAQTIVSLKVQGGCENMTACAGPERGAVERRVNKGDKEGPRENQPSSAMCSSEVKK